MAQVSQSVVVKCLPGIVTDQPEIFESIPSPTDETSAAIVTDDVIDVNNELLDGTFDLKEIPIKDAFAFFAEREQLIAQFFIQRCGEYKIKSDKPDEETDIEKYYRLVSEVTELLNKFKSNKNDQLLDDVNSEKAGALNNTKIVHNLEHLSNQLKVLDFAAHDGSLNKSQSELIDIKSRLENISEPAREDVAATQQHINLQSDPKSQLLDDTSKLIRMSALERRINQLEKLLGNNTDSERALLERTKCDNLYEAAERLSSWLSHFKGGNFDKVNKELDYLSRKLDTIQEKQKTADGVQLDPNTKATLDQLCNMVTATDKHRTMVPTIIHRLNTMEELQHKGKFVFRKCVSLTQLLKLLLTEFLFLS